MDFRQAGRIRWLPEWGFLRLILAPRASVSERGFPVGAGNYQAGDPRCQGWPLHPHVNVQGVTGI